MLLYLFYKRLHPWVSEGVSVGFQPKDKEIWRPLEDCFKKYHEDGKEGLDSAESKPEWGRGKWHISRVQKQSENGININNRKTSNDEGLY